MIKATLAQSTTDTIGVRVSLYDDVDRGTHYDVVVKWPNICHPKVDTKAALDQNRPEHTFTAIVDTAKAGVYPVFLTVTPSNDPSRAETLGYAIAVDANPTGPTYRWIDQASPAANPPPAPATPMPDWDRRRLDLTFSPPILSPQRQFDTVVDFDPIPGVDTYRVVLEQAPSLVEGPATQLKFWKPSRAGEQQRVTFTSLTHAAASGPYPVTVEVQPWNAQTQQPLAIGQDSLRTQATVSVVAQGNNLDLVNALKANFDHVVGSKLAGAVESVASELQLSNRDGVRLARAGDPFKGNPVRRTFWTAIRESSSALTFAQYQDFMNRRFCVPNAANPSQMAMPFSQVDTYLRLKAYTELFLLQNAGILAAPPPGGQLTPESAGGLNAATVLAQVQASRPYLQVVLQNNPDLLASGQLNDLCQRLRYPVLIELIWSYWHEESMMVQTLRAIRDRFQNRIRTPGRDPLAQFEMAPLRPLNNIMWGYIQDEQHRLGVRQRAYEYLHHYGIGLEGKAVGTLRPADSRTRFLQAFHTLLYQCVQFYRQADDTTVVANANNVLWVLKDLHMLLAEGAHNQFGDLPWNARLEMLMEQWILSRPELQDFLRGRRMVPYPEAWMGAVDSMKTLQGWSGTNVIHFRDLGVFGEQILLSVREGGVTQPNPNVGGWSVVTDAAEAAAFALEWRNEIEGYINAYRAVTGVDLTQDPSDPRYLAERDTAPSVHLRRRLAAGAR